MERKEVYSAIDSERNYQEALKKDADRPDVITEFHTGDTLSAIQYNLNKALDVWYVNPAPHQDTLKYLRKIAALCVQIGEVHGMPSRDDDFFCPPPTIKSVQV